MKNLDLNKYGVLEMNAGEMNVVDGGLFWIPAIALYAAYTMLACDAVLVGVAVARKVNQ